MRKTRRKYQKEGSRGKCEILLENQVIGRTIKLDGTYFATGFDSSTLGKFQNLRGAEKSILKFFENSSKDI